VTPRRRALGALLCLGLAAAGAPARSEDAAPLRERTTVTIRGQRVVAEVARTAAEHARGLGDRDGLAPGTGMVFPYTTASRLAFWMKGMRFDIDIVWIREGRIVDLSRFVPAPRAGASVAHALPTVEPKEPADTVLEVVAGTVNARGWQIGDTVRFDPPLH
jgi:uncharacterized membrane protein (UPF0127 family)